MIYKLKITDHAEELLDQITYHLIYRLQNTQAAYHLLDNIEKIYDRLLENPYQFPKSKDKHLSMNEYHEAILPEMNYIIIFKIIDHTVYVAGIFHQSENYQDKLS